MNNSLVQKTADGGGSLGTRQCRVVLSGRAWGALKGSEMKKHAVP